MGSCTHVPSASRARFRLSNFRAPKTDLLSDSPVSEARFRLAINGDDDAVDSPEQLETAGRVRRNQQSQAGGVGRM